MNALQAVEKMNILNSRIEALNAAYTELWKDFDNRWIAIVLNQIQAELEQERGELKEKLESFNI